MSPSCLQINWSLAKAFPCRRAHPLTRTDDAACKGIKFRWPPTVAFGCVQHDDICRNSSCHQGYCLAKHHHVALTVGLPSTWTVPQGVASPETPVAPVPRGAVGSEQRATVGSEQRATCELHRDAYELHRFPVFS